MKFNFNVDALELEIEADYTPERPAPPCRDHDSPRFSDSGDDEEFEIIGMWLLDGDKKIKIPVDICDIICKNYTDDMRDVARSEFEDDFSYAMAEKAYYDELDCNA